MHAAESAQDRILHDVLGVRAIAIPSTRPVPQKRLLEFELAEELLFGPAAILDLKLVRNGMRRIAIAVRFRFLDRQGAIRLQHTSIPPISACQHSRGNDGMFIVSAAIANGGGA